MRVEQGMAKPAATCRPDEPLGRAVDRMLELGVDGLVVVTDARSQRVVGLLEERDALRAWRAATGDAEAIPVASAMTRDPRVCQPGDLMMDALEIMADEGVWRLPVVDREGQLLGVLTLPDVARVTGGDGRGVPVLSRGDVCRALARRAG